LAAKYWLGLNNYKPVNTARLINDLNSPSAKSLVQRLADAAVTVLKSDKAIKSFDKRKETAVVAVGVTAAQDFEKGLSNQLSDYKVFVVTGKESKEELKELLKEIRDRRQIVL